MGNDDLFTAANKFLKVYKAVSKHKPKGEAAKKAVDMLSENGSKLDELYNRCDEREKKDIFDWFMVNINQIDAQLEREKQSA